MHFYNDINNKKRTSGGGKFILVIIALLIHIITLIRTYKFTFRIRNIVSIHNCNKGSLQTPLPRVPAKIFSPLMANE